MDELHMGIWGLIGVLIAMPIYSLWEADKTKLAVIQGRKTKIRMYQETILFLWVPAGLLLLLAASHILTPQELGLRWQFNWKTLAGVLLIVLITSHMIWYINKLRRNHAELTKVAKAMQVHEWMMPSNRTELNWFTWGVSMSAGICEELLFRGFFIGVLGTHIGVIASLLVGSVLFGVCHVYQGWSNVLRTGVIGLLLGCIYLFTESLWIVIALHCMVDIFGGWMGYLVHQSNNAEPALEQTT